MSRVHQFPCPVNDGFGRIRESCKHLTTGNRRNGRRDVTHGRARVPTRRTTAATRHPTGDIRHPTLGRDKARPSRSSLRVKQNDNRDNTKIVPFVLFVPFVSFLCIVVKHTRICSRLTPLTGTWSVYQFVRICGLFSLVPFLPLLYDLRMRPMDSF